MKHYIVIHCSRLELLESRSLLSETPEDQICWCLIDPCRGGDGPVEVLRSPSPPLLHWCQSDAITMDLPTFLQFIGEFSGIGGWRKSQWSLVISRSVQSIISKVVLSGRASDREESGLEIIDRVSLPVPGIYKHATLKVLVKEHETWCCTLYLPTTANMPSTRGLF